MPASVKQVYEAKVLSPEQQAFNETMDKVALFVVVPFGALLVAAGLVTLGGVTLAIGKLLVDAAYSVAGLPMPF